MKKYNTEAIVLKSVNYRDSDRLYTLLTRDFGKISAIARGVRKITSRRSGNLDSLNLITVKITESSKGFKNIDEVQTHSSFKSLKETYPNIVKAFYFAELIHKSVEEDSEVTPVFDLLKDALEDLSVNTVSLDVIVSWFEVLLLKHLGYEINRNLGVGVFDISTTLNFLYEKRLEEISNTHVKNLDPVIKAHIYDHLADRFKSLEF